MPELFLDAFTDAILDSVKLLPFLFITYIIMEYIEHKMNHTSQNAISHAGKLGPLAGSLLGAVPQCGFSAAASSLYAGKVISIGTLLAIFLSTSDEMLPIFISESVPFPTIIRLLLLKILIGIISGLFIDFIFYRILNKKIKEIDIHSVCEHEDCHCQDGILRSAIKHTLKIFLFLFIITFGLNVLIESIGENAISGLFLLTTGIIGLIPNCAASATISKLYLQGVIGTGAMMSGLLSSAGVGLLVLFRLNRNKRENIIILSLLYIFSVLWGMFFQFSGLGF